MYWQTVLTFDRIDNDCEYGYHPFKLFWHRRTNSPQINTAAFEKRERDLHIFCLYSNQDLGVLLLLQALLRFLWAAQQTVWYNVHQCDLETAICTFLSHVLSVPSTLLLHVMSIPCTLLSLVMSVPYPFLLTCNGCPLYIPLNCNVYPHYIPFTCYVTVK